MFRADTIDTSCSDDSPPKTIMTCLVFIYLYYSSRLTRRKLAVLHWLYDGDEA